MTKHHRYGFQGAGLGFAGDHFLSALSCWEETQHCTHLRLALSANDWGAVYFPACLCFVTLSTMSVSRSVIIWRQRRRRGGGMETAFLFSGCEPQPVQPEAACLFEKQPRVSSAPIKPFRSPKEFSFLLIHLAVFIRTDLNWEEEDKLHMANTRAIAGVWFMRGIKLLREAWLHNYLSGLKLSITEPFNNLWNIYKHF